jgi:hypothetical protein
MPKNGQSVPTELLTHLEELGDFRRRGDAQRSGNAATAIDPRLTSLATPTGRCQRLPLHVRASAPSH